MFTVCPKCALTLVVTAEDLRVAQGYVRCGRCSSVFNALARLSEVGQPEATEAAEPRAPAAPPLESAPGAPSADRAGSDAPEEEAIPEDALEFDPSKTDVTSVFVVSQPSPQWTAATGSFKTIIAANQEANQEAAEPAVPPPSPPPASPQPQPPEPAFSDFSKLPPPAQASPGDEADDEIDLELGPDLLASLLLAEPLAPSETPEPPPPAAPPPASAASASSSAAPATPPATAGRDRIAPPRPARAERTSAAAAPTQSAPPPSAEPAPPASEEAPRTPLPARVVRRLRTAAELLDEADRPEARWRYVWAGGALLGLLVLLGQVVNHYRDQLAANARFGRPLTRAYALLGIPLLPHWDLRAYDVRQLGASAEPAGAGLITVRASVKNGARQPQPLPLLRVTLQDRFGNRIAARDVSPRNYLTRRAGAAFLAAGERVDAEMGFVDPGANAVGFEIDACLPTDAGEVSCANDAPAH